MWVNTSEIASIENELICDNVNHTRQLKNTVEQLAEQLVLISMTKFMQSNGVCISEPTIRCTSHLIGSHLIPGVHAPAEHVALVPISVLPAFVPVASSLLSAAASLHSHTCRRRHCVSRTHPLFADGA